MISIWKRTIVNEAKRIKIQKLNEIREKETPTQQFIKLIMKDGKKELAIQTMQKCFFVLQSSLKSNPVQIFEDSLEKVSPLLKVVSSRQRGKIIQRPEPLNIRQRYRQSSKWIIELARKKGAGDFGTRLANQILQIQRGESPIFQTRERLHNLALANRSNIILKERVKR